MDRQRLGRGLDPPRIERAGAAAVDANTAAKSEIVGTERRQRRDIGDMERARQAAEQALRPACRDEAAQLFGRLQAGQALARLARACRSWLRQSRLPRGAPPWHAPARPPPPARPRPKRPPAGRGRDRGALRLGQATGKADLDEIDAGSCHGGSVAEHRLDRVGLAGDGARRRSARDVAMDGGDGRKRKRAERTRRRVLGVDEARRRRPSARAASSAVLTLTSRLSRRGLRCIHGRQHSGFRSRSLLFAAPRRPLRSHARGTGPTSPGLVGVAAKGELAIEQPLAVCRVEHADPELRRHGRDLLHRAGQDQRGSGLARRRPGCSRCRSAAQAADLAAAPTTR